MQNRTIPVARAEGTEPLDERSLLQRRIARLERALAEACRSANHDPMTEIPNRRLLEDRFEQAKARSDRHRKSLAVLFLDIDGFKRINDTHGHVVGDDLLRQFATRLVGCVRTSDTVCRYGGDEFAILLPETEGRTGAISATLKIREHLNAPYVNGRASIALSASIGMALWPTDGLELGRLIEEADSAMYREKVRKGGQQCATQQKRVDPAVNGAACAATGPGQIRTHSEAQPSFHYALDEDACTRQGAPPPAIHRPRNAIAQRNSK
jgi:diguanylate cyclase (GGDEF)-like protein